MTGVLTGPGLAWPWRSGVSPAGRWVTMAAPRSKTGLWIAIAVAVIVVIVLIALARGNGGGGGY